MAASLKQSKQPEVIRLHSIDGTYRTHLYHTFTDALESAMMAGLLPRSLGRNYPTLLRLLNDGVYNYITLLRRPRKTLGE